MSKASAAIGRKVFSLALIFNSIFSLISVTNILASFYTDTYGWQPFSPYLIDGSLFWFIIVTAALNIVPAKLVGNVDIKRILFHHYVYGFLVSSVSFLLVAFFAPACVIFLFMPSLGFQTTIFQIIPVYASLFFIYGGLTLVVDDIHDVSSRLKRRLDRLKIRMHKSGKALQAIHLCSSLISIYIMVCCVLWYSENIFLVKSWPLWDASHVVFALNLFVTGIWGLRTVKKKSWFTKFFTDLQRNESFVHGK